MFDWGGGPMSLDWICKPLTLRDWFWSRTRSWLSVRTSIKSAQNSCSVSPALQVFKLQLIDCSSLIQTLYTFTKTFINTDSSLLTWIQWAQLDTLQEHQLQFYLSFPELAELQQKTQKLQTAAWQLSRLLKFAVLIELICHHELHHAPFNHDWQKLRKWVLLLSIAWSPLIDGFKGKQLGQNKVPWWNVSQPLS